ncbi:peroxidase 55-like [Gossypium australe]|uniref:peroxidase n=1 Tax=Gossypium australe TaxID=47621 RepID=A0A5B6V522_9ROSI|nr:peroxidase 55-like [Gossypium australe]
MEVLKRGLVLLMVFMVFQRGEGQLFENFYRGTCPNLEMIVKQVVSTKFSQTFVTIPATLRLFFHDCFVEGCDASVMIASPNGDAEKDAQDNLSLAGDGFDTVIKAKQAVEKQCPGIVSCADILALAARDVVVLAGGPSWEVELGRRDGLVSQASKVAGNLPDPEFNLVQLNTIFAKNNLTQFDMIALSGAHTLGFSHCNRFSNRLYSSSSPVVDPSLDPNYAQQLMQACPQNVDPSIAINMDPETPRTFDNVYYQNLVSGKGLFTSDEVLFSDPASQPTGRCTSGSKLICNSPLGQKFELRKKMEIIGRCFTLFILVIILRVGEGKLSQAFYNSTCPNVESIGCDASIMIASPNGDAEKDAPDNLSLAGDGFDTVIKAKKAVEAKCPKVVSCADILAIATRDVIVLAGGPSFEVELGRRDGLVSKASSVAGQLPGPNFNLSQLNSMFAQHNLTQTDMIALSGTHTVGFSHCSRFANRLYSFSPSSPVDPDLDPTYVKQLKQACPQNVDPSIAINMDPVTPRTFDNKYFKNLVAKKGLFTSDEVLYTNRTSRPTVVRFSKKQNVFKEAFITAMRKLGRVGVKTDRGMLVALANSGIRVIVSIPNEQLLGIGQSNSLQLIGSLGTSLHIILQPTSRQFVLVPRF